MARRPARLYTVGAMSPDGAAEAADTARTSLGNPVYGYVYGKTSGMGDTYNEGDPLGGDGVGLSAVRVEPCRAEDVLMDDLIMLRY